MFLTIPLIYLTQGILLFIIYYYLFKTYPEVNPEDDKDYLNGINFCLCVISVTFTVTNLIDLGVIFPLFVGFLWSLTIMSLSEMIAYTMYDFVHNRKY